MTSSIEEVMVLKMYAAIIKKKTTGFVLVRTPSVLYFDQFVYVGWIIILIYITNQIINLTSKIAVINIAGGR